MQEKVHFSEEPLGKAWQSLRPIGNSSIKFNLLQNMEQFGSPNSLTTEEDIFECTGTEQEDNLPVQRLVML